MDSAAKETEPGEVHHDKTKSAKDIHPGHQRDPA